MPCGCLVCVICNSNSFHSFIFKLCLIYCSYIENMHLLFCIHFMIFFFIIWGLELRHFFCKMCRGCLVCIICNSKSLHFLLFKLCIMIIHTRKYMTVHLQFCANLINIFLYFRSVELKIFYPSEMLRGCLVCVICDSSSFHSFIFKLNML